MGLFRNEGTSHGLCNRRSNRLSCVVIDEARRTFEEDIGRVLVDIKLAKRLQRVVAAALPPDGQLRTPPPPQPYYSPRRAGGNLLAHQQQAAQLRRPLRALV